MQPFTFSVTFVPTRFHKNPCPSLFLLSKLYPNVIKPSSYKINKQNKGKNVKLSHFPFNGFLFLFLSSSSRKSKIELKRTCFYFKRRRAGGKRKGKKAENCSCTKCFDVKVTGIWIAFSPGKWKPNHFPTPLPCALFFPPFSSPFYSSSS